MADAKGLLNRASPTYNVSTHAVIADLPRLLSQQELARNVLARWVRHSLLKCSGNLPDPQAKLRLGNVRQAVVIYGMLIPRTHIRPIWSDHADLGGN
jgi:hypothetical protein